MGYNIEGRIKPFGKGVKWKWKKKISIQLLGQIFEKANGALRIDRKKEPEARCIVEADF